MKDYKPLQIRTNVKNLIKEICEEKGISQSGLISAIIYTLEGRQNFGTIELDWTAISKYYPAPLQMTSKQWSQATEKLTKVLDKYLTVHIVDAADEAGVDRRMIWTIMCFLYDRGRLEEWEDGCLIFEGETQVILHEEDRALFDQTWSGFMERKQRRISGRNIDE